MGICNCKYYYRINKLKKTTNDIPLFTFEGLNCYGKIVDVYDGDTFKVCIYHNNRIIKINCRSLGYDSPEIKPRLNIKNREEHIKKAREAKEYLIKQTTNKSGLVYLNCHKFDKYGRVLVTIYKNKYSKKSINDEMIEKGHGYRYHGGTKLLST